LGKRLLYKLKGGDKMRIKDICEVTGKTREEIEDILDKQDVIELKLIET